MVTEIIVKQNQQLIEENERLKYALKVLQQELDECRKILEVKKEVQTRLKETKALYSTKEIIAITKLFRKDIRELPLSIRTQNVLYTTDIRTLGDIIKIGRSGLLRVPHCGPAVKKDIEQCMQNLGLCWNINMYNFVELDAQKAVSKAVNEAMKD